jgi:hypothetical protein
LSAAKFAGKASCYLATSTGGFILFCEPCFETFNVFYKREMRNREEQGIILEDELANIYKNWQQN